MDTMVEPALSVKTPRTVASLRTPWKEFFGGDLKAVKAAGISGQLATSPFRSVCWKLFLGGLDDTSMKTWIETTSQSRAKYETLRKRYVLDLRDKMKSEADLRVNNPLSQSEDSPWKRFFEDTELQRTIQQDVERTYPDQPFFRSERIQNMLLDILFIFSRENHSVSYRQGMHELLALIIWVVDSCKADISAIEPNNELDQLISTMLHPNYVEHDAHVIFDKLMETALPWFDTGQKQSTSHSSEMLEGAMLFGKPVQETASSSTAVIRKCYRIQHQLLKQYDPKLYDHLSGLGIEPQLYGIRWMRLLFGREFHIADVLRLWDGIFADDSQLSIVDYMCVSMLLFLREQLLQADYTSAMSRLMKFPPVEDVVWLLERAIQIRDAPFERKPIPINTQSSRTQAIGIKQARSVPPQFGKQAPVTTQPPAQPRLSNNNRSFLPSSSAPSSRSTNSPRLTSPPIIAPSSSPSDPFDSAFSREKELVEQIANLTHINEQMAGQITKGIAVLRKELLNTTEERQPNMDTVNLVLAALKQVRDILSGELTYSPEVLKINGEAFDAALNESGAAAVDVGDTVIDDESGEVDAFEIVETESRFTAISQATDSTTTLDRELDANETSKERPQAVSAKAEEVAPTKKAQDLFADVEDDDAESFWGGKHVKPEVNASGLENLLV